MSEFGGLRKHENTQHAPKSGRVISLLIVATIMEEEERTALNTVLQKEWGRMLF